MPDLTPGRQTSEFLVHVGAVGAQWTAVALTTIASLDGAVPAKYAVYLAALVTVLHAAQAACYVLARSNVKIANLDAQADAGAAGDSSDAAL